MVKIENIEKGKWNVQDEIIHAPTKHVAELRYHNNFPYDMDFTKYLNDKKRDQKLTYNFRNSLANNGTESGSSMIISSGDYIGPGYGNKNY